MTTQRESAFDPEARIAGFVAKRPAEFTVPAPPPLRHATPIPTRPPPPFGNWRANRVAYSINLTPALSERLDRVIRSAPGQTSYGALGVDAIRETWTRIREAADLTTSDGQFPFRRMTEGRLASGDRRIRKVFYVTLDEAAAIHSVQQQLGGMELGQLHRLALDLYLPSDAADLTTDTLSPSPPG